MLGKVLKKIGLYTAVMGLPFICYAIADEVKTHTQTEVVFQQQELNLQALVSKRLELAQEFSKAHWNQALPIDNPDQEKAQIENIQLKAKEMGLDPVVVTSFFLAQNEACKMVMIENFDVWVAQDLHKHETAADSAILQEKLNALDDQILISLKNEHAGVFSNKEALKATLAKELQSKGFSREVIDSATHF
jgi:chorismate mutase